MARILTSLHGRLLGLGHRKELIAPEGVVSGRHGKQIHAPAPSVVSFLDDFTRGLDTNTWLATEGTDSATSAAATLSGGIGGVLRLTTGDAGTGLAADTEQLTQKELMWQASNGGLAAEFRLKLSAITTCYVFIGFTDTVAAALEAPIESAASANTLTSNASNAVGVMFDTRMSTDNWWLVGVKADVDATAQNSGFAPVADTYETWRIEVDTSGNATFYRNGVSVGTVMSNAITAATDLTLVMTASKTSVAASMTVDIDYVHASMLRGLDGTAV